MENFSKPGVILRIGLLGKLGRFESTTEIFFTLLQSSNSLLVKECSKEIELLFLSYCLFIVFFNVLLQTHSHVTTDDRIKALQIVLCFSQGT